MQAVASSSGAQPQPVAAIAGAKATAAGPVPGAQSTSPLSSQHSIHPHSQPDHASSSGRDVQPAQTDQNSAATLQSSEGKPLMGPPPAKTRSGSQPCQKTLMYAQPEGVRDSACSDEGTLRAVLS